MGQAAHAGEEIIGERRATDVAVRRRVMRKFALLPACAAVLVFVGSAVADCGNCGKCVCKAVKTAGTGWCDHCAGGAMYGVKMKSAKLFKALAGKKIEDPAKIKCTGCKAASKKNGACKGCHVAFNDGKMYKAPVSQVLSKGVAVDAKKVKCEGCTKALASKKSGYCSACDGGFVGGLAFHGKELYQQAKEAWSTLTAATKASTHCEKCAVAMVTDGVCDKCEVRYKDGKKAERRS